MKHKHKRGTHEQNDYILTQNRWKNTVKNAESDTNANIDSDHYPGTLVFKTHLSKTPFHKKYKPKYKLTCPVINVPF